eukprot:TRINITY_DN2697_c0_g1_i1.p1 TRINITY_DN2697_c0_g1~~TRINITY_DN2697_c0_g1_i1.p1  ORF type:complete len:872 (-),score=214.61 TRINITY_DN2697_c0_g1_i1:89-2704(-)
MCRPRGRLRRRPPPTRVPVVKEEPPIPLESVQVKVKIVDFTAQVEVTQKFKNSESQPIEAVYQFPIEEKNTICDFVAVIDGKVIKGECQEKEEAKDLYDDSIAEGSGAYLLEKSEDDPHVFNVNVGNLPPGKEVEVKITYVCELDFSPEGLLEFSLPSSTPEESTRNGYGKEKAVPLTLTIELDMSSNIRSLSSPSHPISFEFGEEPNQATVTLSNESGENGCKEFLLNTKLSKPHDPCVQASKDSSGDYAAMVSLYPKPADEDEDIYTEMIFVVDRSGSMSGSRINQVKATLEVFLRSLGEGTMFNIVGFGTRTEFLFKSGSVEYNDKNLETATNHVKKLRANLGGTNIKRPLEAIFKQKTIDGYPRQLFILTDGEVSNTQECVDYVKQHSDTTRVFTFGVGAEASQDLVKGMAKAAYGYYEFIKSGENMDNKVMRQLNRAMQPALTDISIEWGSLEAHMTPFRQPPLFVGGRMVVYGFVDKSNASVGEITLKAKTALGPYETKVTFDPSKAKDGTHIHKLATRSMLKDLEDKRSYLHDNAFNLVSGIPATAVKDEMVRLSKKYGVLCRHTAFIAVEERDVATEGTMQLRKGAAASITKGQTKEQAQKLKLQPPQPVFNSLAMQSSILPPSRPAFAIHSSCAPSATKTRCCRRGKVGCCKKDKKRKRKYCKAPKKRIEAYSVALEAEEDCIDNLMCDMEMMQPKREMLICEKKMEQEQERSKQSEEASYRMEAQKKAEEARHRMEAEKQEAEKRKQEALPSAELTAIILKQKANGTWIPNDVISLLAGFSLEKVKQGMPTTDSAVNADIEALWFTAVVASFLKLKFPLNSTNWQQVYNKAKRYIAKTKKKLSITPDIDWLAKAEALVSAT